MKLTFNVPHSMELPALRARIEERVAHYDRSYPKYNIRHRYRWVSDTRAEGNYLGASGVVELHSNTVTAELELPFLALPFRGKIEALIEKECATVLGTQNPTPARPS